MSHIAILLAIYLFNIFCKSTGLNDVMGSNFAIHCYESLSNLLFTILLSFHYSKRVVCHIAICYLQLFTIYVFLYLAIRYCFISNAMMHIYHQ